MNIRFLIFISIILILFLSLGFVSANGDNAISVADANVLSDDSASLPIVYDKSNPSLTDVLSGDSSIYCNDISENNGNGDYLESSEYDLNNSFISFEDKKLSSESVNNQNIIKPYQKSFEGIRKAINQSNENDIILLEGNYDFDEDDWDNEINISKNLIFEGIDGSIGNSYGYFLKIENSTVVFNNLTFIADCSSFFEADSSNLIFNDCFFESGDFTLRSHNSSFNNCIFEACFFNAGATCMSFENSAFVLGRGMFEIVSDYVSIINTSFEHDSDYEFNYINSKHLNIADSSFYYCSVLSKSFMNVPIHMSKNNKSIEINTLDNESADIEISGDFSYEATVQGQAFISLENLKEGFYNIVISYVSDSSYIVNNYNFSVIGKKIEDFLIDFPKQINSAEYTYSDEPGVTNEYEFHISNLPLYFNGKLKCFVDGDEVYVGSSDNKNGRKEFLLCYEFEEGSHNFTVFYEGDEYFNAINSSIEVFVAPITFNVFPDKIVFDHIYDAYGNLTIKINGETYRNLSIKSSPYPYTVYRVDDGWRYYENYGNFVLYNTTLIDLDLKDGESYQIEAIYEGNYGKYITVDTINLDYSDEDNDSVYYYIVVNNTDCLYCDEYLSGNNTTQILLPNLDDINVTLTIDGEEFVFHENCINISNLSFGTHKVNVNYSGDDNYPSYSFDFDINVYGRAVLNENADLDGIIVYNADQKAKLSLLLPADAAGNITLYYKNGTKYKVYKTVEVKNGKASMVVKGIAGFINYQKTIGLNYFKTKFTGNYKIREEVYKVIFQPVSYTEKSNFVCESVEDGKLKITVNQYFYDEYNCEQKNRTFTLGTYNVRNGVLKIPLSKFPIGMLSMDYTFTSASGKKISGWAYVEKSTKLTLRASNISMFYNDGTKYSLQLINKLSYVKKGTVVNVKIGSKTYKAKVGDKGWVKLSISQLPGTYAVTASYKNKTVKTKLVVKQILTLKKVTVRKYAKSLVLTASLKKVKGKYLKGKKITFKFNGKKYTAKTNSKGIVKVTIKKSVLKKLKVGKKITYTATYVKTTVKQTVKVKR